MCGILGSVSNDRNSVKRFKAALQTLSHRGPDSEGMNEFELSKRKLILGQKRLAIIDLNPQSNQPMSDHTGHFWIIFNGEIYNYLELKSALKKKGHKFKTASDTEVILEGYKEYGLDIFGKLRGMFAIGLYDKKANKLIIARDHFGKKPLYYYLVGDTLVFGSELKALVSFISDKTKLSLDREAIIKFLMYGYIPSPRSIYSEIKKLPPATAIEIDLKNLTISKTHKFWQPHKIKLIEEDFLDAVSKVDDLLKESVRRRLIADVPVGSFLSGGIDSSIVTTIASSLHPGIETFSVVYSDKKFDESEYVKMVGDKLPIKYNLFNFKDKFAPELMDEVLSLMDEPMADASLLPTTFVSKHTRKKVTVALSGDGGDELFGGYPKYNAQKLADNTVFMYLLRAGNAARGLIDRLPITIEKKNIYKKLLEGVRSEGYSRHFVWGSGSFTFSELNKLLRSVKVSEEKIFSESKSYFESFKQKDKGNRLLFLDAMIQLPDWYLVKADRGAMSQSLEVRSPLLDVDLAEYVMSLPSSYKFSLKKNKILLKSVAKDYLPREVIDRKKMGFGLPLNKWLTTQFKKEVELSLASLPEELFNKDYVNLLWSSLIKGKSDNGTKIWRLFILGSFLRKYGN